MPRAVHFDIVVPDVQRAITFYESAFGWSIKKWDGPMEYWLVSTGPGEREGINGGLSQGDPSLTEGQLTLDVDPVAEAVRRVIDASGTVAREPSPVPGIGYLAEIVDTEGNRFGLMQDDPAAGT